MLSVIPDSTLARYAQVRYARFPAPSKTCGPFAVAEWRGVIQTRLCMGHARIRWILMHHVCRLCIPRFLFRSFTKKPGKSFSKEEGVNQAGWRPYR